VTRAQHQHQRPPRARRTAAKILLDKNSRGPAGTERARQGSAQHTVKEILADKVEKVLLSDRLVVTGEFWLERQHGANHEGPGVARQLDEHVHGLQEDAGAESRTQHRCRTAGLNKTFFICVFSCGGCDCKFCGFVGETACLELQCRSFECVCHPRQSTDTIEEGRGAICCCSRTVRTQRADEFQSHRGFQLLSIRFGLVWFWFFCQNYLLRSIWSNERKNEDTDHQHEKQLRRPAGKIELEALPLCYCEIWSPISC
jgi:hypothetical protein